MRNTGLKNSNYCMTVVGVAPPLCDSYVCVGIISQQSIMVRKSY